MTLLAGVPRAAAAGVKKLRLRRETLRALQTLTPAGMRLLAWTPIVLLAVGAAGCTDTLGCYHN
jgi:hypothetical protein